MPPDVFISYSHKDIATARKIDAFLSQQGIDVWRDERMSPGVKFEGEIQEKLKNSSLCLFLLSRAFLASEYCQNEVGFTEAYKIPFLPCRLDTCKPKGFLATRNFLDLSSVDENDFDYLPPWQLYQSVRKTLRSVKEEPLKNDLLDFYTRLRHLLGDTNIATQEHLTLRKSSILFQATEIEQLPRSRAISIINNIVSYLENGGPIENLFTLSKGFFGNKFSLPAWRLRVLSMDKGIHMEQVRFLPDFILSGTYDDETVMEATIHLLQRNHGYSSSEGSSFYLQTLLPTVFYNRERIGYKKDATERQLWKEMVGSGPADIRKGELVFIPSKGVYRIVYFNLEEQYTRIALTKYLDMAAARLKLGIHSTFGKATSNTDTEKQEAVAGLTLLYMGYNSFDGMEFMLHNNSQSTAVVHCIDVMVHNFTPRPPQPAPGPGYPLPEYKYEACLQPQKGCIRITNDSYKYPPGEIDKFKIQFYSKVRGYDYEISVLVEWMNLQTGQLTVLETPKEIIGIPWYN